MHKPSIKFAHLCESYIVDQSNKLSIINIFGNVRLSDLPTVYPKMLVVGLLEGLEQDESVDLSIELKDPEGKIALNTAVNVVGTAEQSTGFITELNNIELKKQGLYTFNIKVNNEIKYSIDLKVSRSNENGNKSN